ncbi:MAG: bacillithiol biosynthesis deacetylase BshB1 [Chloroflexi bacterium]|nr:bacillithiol biosynthesis deacetylase BshB1 [Chloroflexota bacterium]
MSNALDILVFSPHPDDAELACGGSLIMAAHKGLRVAIADVSEGESSSRGTPEIRKKEKAAATGLLGLCDRFSMGLPDTRIGADPDDRLAIIDIVRETRPRIVLAPYWEDRHPDHRATGKLVRDAVFYAGVALLGQGRPHRPEGLFHYMIHQPFSPSFVVDISTVWKKKMDVLMSYSSQFQSDGPGLQTALSRPEFMRFIEARAIWFGAMIGANYGEPFVLAGPVPTRGLPGMDDVSPRKSDLPPFSMLPSQLGPAHKFAGSLVGAAIRPR